MQSSVAGYVRCSHYPSLQSADAAAAAAAAAAVAAAAVAAALIEKGNPLQLDPI